MNKEITAPHPVDEVTGLNQRKKLKSISINVDTDFLAFSYKVQKLDPKWAPLKGHEVDDLMLRFDSHPVSTPGGTFQTEIPQDIKDAMAAIKAIAEPLFIKYGVERVEAPTEDKEVDDEV